MDYQQNHGYMRHPPPPPSAADPFQRPPVPPPPPPPNHPWPYAAPQFHYQPQTQNSPSPPPAQWPPPPPHSSDHAQYPPPPPYPAHQPPPYPAHPHYPLPAPPPLPPRPSQPAQPYSQDWRSGSWIHHQSRQYPTAANNNEEDWAARAKAWAAAKSVSDNQQTLPQFVPDGRFHNQYSQSMDPQYIDGHAPLAPASNYHQFPVAMGVSNRSSGAQMQDSRYMSSGQSSYDADTHAPFASRDGGTAGDSIPPFPPQERSPITPLVHQQEVPSSYSSISGNLEVGDRYGRLNSSSSIPVTSLPQHHNQHIPPTTGRSGWVGEPHHVLGSHPAESRTDMSDQPLNFAPHFNRDPENRVQPNYAYSSSISVRDVDPAGPSNYVWPTSAATGPAYPPAPQKMSFGLQADHPIALPSPVSGNTAQTFPSGSGFQPTVPIIGAAFGVGAGVTPHPTTFPGDAYGVAERPKKASVPNWLREEIIKNRAVITSSNSAPNLPKEVMEDDNNDESSMKGDQSDSKSIDSSGSTEDEDEDEVEAARSAAINQEIKRVLTEVLLKVTDELFDEIATKVLKEDDLSVEVGRDSDLSNHLTLPSTPSVSTPKASAKVLIPTRTKGSDDKDASEKSTSGSPGDVLGLASYASDEEDEILSSRKLNSNESSTYHHSSSSKLLEGDPAKLDASSTVGMVSGSVANVESNDNMAAKDTQRLSGIAENEFHHGYDTSNFSYSLTEKSVKRNEAPDGKFEPKRRQDNDSQIKNTGNGSYINDQLENKKSSMKKEYIDSESLSGRLHKKGDEEHGRHEERHTITDRDAYHDNLKDKSKEKGKTDEKAKKIESRKRLSPDDDKEGTRETHKDRRTSSKKDDDVKRKERTGDERKDRSRLKSGVESTRYKRRRSSSVGARDRDNKDNSVVSRANDSSNESSDDSKRKSHHSRRRHKSPLSTRTRKRQVSRSPSKHSKRRHSPYSSLESTRGKKSPSRSRSRSRSPVHRRR